MGNWLIVTIYDQLIAESYFIALLFVLRSQRRKSYNRKMFNNIEPRCTCHILFLVFFEKRKKLFFCLVRRVFLVRASLVFFQGNIAVPHVERSRG